MTLLALQFLVAHVLGDFVFQPNNWVEDKKIKKHQSKYLYFHIGVHAIALLLFLQFDLHYLPAILVVLLTHFGIDLLKLKLSNKQNERWMFVLDQILHLSIILGIVFFYERLSVDFNQIYSKKNLLLILAILGVTQVSAIVIQVIMSRWNMESVNDKQSLDDAGRWIGILERLFVFGFLILDRWDAIGLLLTAKSVFRFGDLTRAKDRKLTEYVLIGTLISFGLAIAIGLGYKYLLGN